MNTMRSALKPPSDPQALPLLLSFHSGSSAAFLTCARNSMRSWPSALVSPPAHALSNEMYCPSHRTAAVAQTLTRGGSTLRQNSDLGLLLSSSVGVSCCLVTRRLYAEVSSSLEVTELCRTPTCHDGAWHLENLQQLL